MGGSFFELREREAGGCFGVLFGIVVVVIVAGAVASCSDGTTSGGTATAFVAIEGGEVVAVAIFCNVLGD